MLTKMFLKLRRLKLHNNFSKTGTADNTINFTGATNLF